MWNPGKSTEPFQTPVAFDVAGLESVILTADTRQELWVYGGDYIRDKSPGMPGEVVAQNLDAVYDSNFDDDD